MSAPQMPPHLQMVRLLGGFRVSRVLDALVELDVAERLTRGPRSVEDLAAETGAHAPSLRRVLRAAAAFGIFAEDTEGRFFLSPDAELLRKDARGSVHASVRVFGQAWHWNMWGGLLDTLRTGQPAFVAQNGVDFDTQCAKDPALAASVAESKAQMYEPSDEAIVAAYDFASARHVVEIGGGCGALVARILRAYPCARGTVYDRPAALEAARCLLKTCALEGRCDVEEGDWLERVPRGDVVILRGLLHYYDDEVARRILASCRRSLRDGDRLLVAEMLLPPGNAMFVGKLIDVESMLLTSAGRERTEAEYVQLIEDAGFRVERVIATAAPISVIEASAVGAEA